MFSCKLLFAVLGLWFFLSKRVSGGDMFGIKQFMSNDMYWHALHIKTGYEKFVPSGELTSPNAGDIMTRGVYFQLNNLVCGYVFSAHLHLHLTKTELEKTQQLKDHPMEFLKELSFKKQAKLMLTTMYNMNIDRGTQELWLVFVYMKVLEEYVQSIRYKQEIYVSIGKDMATIHDAIMVRLTEYVADYCIFENVFNYRFQDSLFHRGDNSEDNKKEFRLIDDWVSLNKDMVEKLIYFNQKFEVLTIGMENFSYRRLSLNGITSVKHGYLKALQDKIPVGLDWQNAFADITVHLNKAWSERWPDQRIYQLGRFQKDLVSALKVFMLRILWMHALYISDTQNSLKNLFVFIANVYVARMYNKQVSTYLTEFINYFYLTEDESFKKINYLLGGILKSISPKSNSALVVEEIQKALTAISAEFDYCDVTVPVEFDKQQLNDPIVQSHNTNNNVDASQPIDDLAYWMIVSSNRVKQFVENITLILGDVDFRVIGWFIKASQELKPLKKSNHSSDSENMSKQD